MAKRAAKAVTNGTIYCLKHGCLTTDVGEMTVRAYAVIGHNVPRLIREGRVLVRLGYVPSELCIVYDDDTGAICVMPEAVARG